MSRRNYEQVCALACALDVVGERWTLMIARELIFGPRRYSDLLRQLPGLGTNLLAQRLKDLEQAELIAQRRLPPPAASAVYELSAKGRESLLPIIRAMTDLGVTYLQYPPPSGHFVPVSSTMGALSKFFQREQAAGFFCRVEFHTDSDVFQCVIANGVMTELGFGSLAQPDLVLEGSTDIFMGLVVGYESVAAAMANGQLNITHGDAATAEAFFALFRSPHHPMVQLNERTIIPSTNS
ncbi:MAG: transcriptional regulator [Caldilineaceae bacterium]|nr:transcriptional regulator [Caldilineaceae bacterium]MCB9147765.1 transcriptional regulator [Caldilineaceae bacterium]